MFDTNPATALSLTNQCKATLQALVTCEAREHDVNLRARLRLHIRLSHEAGFALGLSEPTKELGALMAKANNRSRSRGWL